MTGLNTHHTRQSDTQVTGFNAALIISDQAQANPTTGAQKRATVVTLFVSVSVLVHANPYWV